MRGTSKKRPLDRGCALIGGVINLSARDPQILDVDQASDRAGMTFIGRLAPMSAFGGKADVRELPAVCPLIAISGH